MSSKEGVKRPPEKPFHELDPTHNPYENDPIKLWHDISCVMRVFVNEVVASERMRWQDINAWRGLSKEDKQRVWSVIEAELENYDKKSSPEKRAQQKSQRNSVTPKKKVRSDVNHKDNSFRVFWKLCCAVANASSAISKTKIISEFFKRGTDNDGFKGDVELWCKMLLPGSVLRMHDLKSRQLIKLFSKILGTDKEKMLEDSKKGNVARTICEFFKKSTVITPCPESTLTLQDVEEFLSALSKTNKKCEQCQYFTEITKKCTSFDLDIIIRLLMYDIRSNAGSGIISGAHGDSPKGQESCRDLGLASGKNNSNTGLSTMTPVLPMLAQVCRSVSKAFEKCPNGMFSEVKYNGERVQLHKQGESVRFFSRSLKPVLADKVAHFQDVIPKAFPNGNDLILDGELLLLDKTTGKPLPNDTSDTPRKKYKDANPCLFVFDCLLCNGQSLLNTTIKERREILRRNMVEVENEIVLTEAKEVHQPKELEEEIEKVLSGGVEGLVLKDLNSAYEPGQRLWLKVKRSEGAMPDTVDLVVLGAWTGSEGGSSNSFLMGCHDQEADQWVTVAKVERELDDSAAEKLRKKFVTVGRSKDPSKVPKWLSCHEAMTPDVVATDPKKMPVWEITGASITRSNEHTAHGLSVRAPRVIRTRSDKNWMSATNLKELESLYEASLEKSDFRTVKRSKRPTTSESGDSPGSKKRKRKSEGKKDSKKGKKSTDAGVYEDDTETETEPEEVKTDELKVTNSLHDIFTGCVIQFPKDHRHYNLLRRYIIAYDGALYDEEKKNALENPDRAVTHVVHLSETSCVRNEKYWAKDVSHVHVSWVWDSIKLLEKQPECRYVVTAKDGS